MRLITGATWSEDDRAAYLKGVEALKGSMNRTLVKHFGAVPKCTILETFSCSAAS